MKTEVEIREALSLIADEVVRDVLTGRDKGSMGYEAGIGTALGWMLGSPVESLCFERVLATVRGERPHNVPDQPEAVSPNAKRKPCRTSKGK